MKRSDNVPPRRHASWLEPSERFDAACIDAIRADAVLSSTDGVASTDVVSLTDGMTLTDAVSFTVCWLRGCSLTDCSLPGCSLTDVRLAEMPLTAGVISRRGES